MAAFVLPAPQNGSQQVKLGKDIAQPAGEHFLTLERAAQREQGYFGYEGECGGITMQAAIVWCRPGGNARRTGEAAARPGMACGPQRVPGAVGKMLPHDSVECIFAGCLVAIAQRGDLLHKIRVRAYCALPKDNKATCQNIGALYGDRNRQCAVQIAKIVAWPVDHSLAGVNVHGVVHRFPHALGGMQLHDGRHDRRFVP